MDFSDAELSDLYDRYAPVLHHRAMRILKNDELARDAVHETFAKVIRNADTFRSQSSPLTWMYSISTNYCLNQIRNKKTRAGLIDRHRDDLVGVTATTDTTSALDSARVVALLDAADDQTRRVVLHTYFDDCTRQEVADLVGISVPTVRKRLNAFLDTARKHLGAVAPLLALAAWSTP